MVFKLVRIDAEEPNKIQLALGTHLIGRGKFLECEDKRISRNHGHLIITEDGVTIEALHQNPCFFTKKGSEEKQVLKKSFKETLDNGDRFGLLPGSYWYEILLCTADMDSQATDVSNTQELATGDDISTNHENNQHNSRAAQDINCENSPYNDRAADKTINHENGPHNDSVAEEKTTNNENSQNDNIVCGGDGNAASDAGQGENEDSFVNFDLNETVDNAGRAESPSLLDQQNEPQHDSANQSMDPAPPTPDPTATDNPDPPEPTPENPPEQTESQHPESKSPKRSHSPDEDDAVKRIKTEPVDVKQEVKREPDDGQAGPSDRADQAGASHDAGGSKAPPSPVPGPRPPVPGPQPPRERCIYGASCYRRNPAHKAQFAHPSDSDWGTGDKAPCPYGAACRKRDPRHWQVHEHPPQARPPAPVPTPKPRAKKRRQHSASDSDSSSGDSSLVLTTKRARKPLPKVDGDSEGEEDPYASDGSDDWVPPSDYTETPDY